MAKPMVNGRQIVIRMPGELLDALQLDADSNGRTLTQSIRFLLAKSPAIADRLEQAAGSSV